MTRYLIVIAWLLVPPMAGAEQFAAKLDWSRRVVLSTPVSGVIHEVLVRPGEQVTAGQALLRLDQRPFRSRLQETAAQVGKQRLRNDEAQRELERTRELYERTVISVHDLQLAEIAAASARADFESAQAARDAAQLALEYSEVRAPFAGIVLAVPVSAGMTVINSQQATPLVTLAQQRPMYVRVPVPGAVLDRLTPGQQATVSAAGARYNAILDYTGAEPDDSGHYRLTFSFDPDGAVLRAGQAAQVELP